MPGLAKQGIGLGINGVADPVGEFFLIEVPRYEARKKKKELERRGMTVPHTELV